MKLHSEISGTKTMKNPENARRIENGFRPLSETDKKKLEPILAGGVFAGKDILTRCPESQNENKSFWKNVSLAGNKLQEGRHLIKKDGLAARVGRDVAFSSAGIVVSSLATEFLGPAGMIVGPAAAGAVNLIASNIMRGGN